VAFFGCLVDFFAVLRAVCLPRFMTILIPRCVARIIGDLSTGKTARRARSPTPYNKTISAISHIEFRGSYPSTAEVSNDAYCFSLSLPATFKKINILANDSCQRTMVAGKAIFPKVLGRKVMMKSSLKYLQPRRFHLIVVPWLSCVASRLVRPVLVAGFATVLAIPAGAGSVDRGGTFLKLTGVGNSSGLVTVN
jgi:hypothetical protein